ncbi:PREDICTED: uncharacterized protein LOC109240364 [Nicotiana attenuata]|uniref:uncharacterized protein LOC109240364 n=1 Tax=Nicotiana attenuata TaxID=49451 RepID=UPI000905D2DB|nr:PREDICTED: uncharacterized protein LOC109240364 [Nicotiana attenuata]
MRIPPGLQISSSSSSTASPLVCKLRKSLYGLKQASRQWFSKLSDALLSRGYIASKNDYSLFTKSSGASLVILVVYVDDILLAGSDIAEMTALKQFLDDQFKIKDLGLVHYFMGLEVSSHPDGYVLHQHKYTSDLLEEFKCSHLSPLSTPLDPSIKLTVDMGDPLPDPSIYRRLVGKLNFLQHTRPDVAYSVQHLSQFLQTPRVPHMLAALHVLRYLMTAPAQGVLLSNTPDFALAAFSDSDWATCAHSRRSVTGFFITLGGCPISWKSKKQPTISLSSVEAEYRALRKVAAEVSWLVRLLGDLGLSITAPVPVFCDSQAALHVAKNPVFHERMKHIEVDCHYVRDCLSSGLISLQFVRSSAQLADIMTKALHGPLHHSLLGKLGVFSPSSLKGGVNGSPNSGPTPTHTQQPT